MNLIINGYILNICKVLFTFNIKNMFYIKKVVYFFFLVYLFYLFKWYLDWSSIIFNIIK